MKYETIKSFILVVLVGVSFLLTFILWTYQPKYDQFYDTSYVNEVDVGGEEKTKNELIEPKSVMFHNGETVSGFSKPIDRQRFFKDLASWVLYEYEETDAQAIPESDYMVEITFPTIIPVDLITNLFTFNDQITAPNWDFDRVYILLDTDKQVSELVIVSSDNTKQITATIEKLETYYQLVSYMEDESELIQDFMAFDNGNELIYIPRDITDLSKKTFIASTIEPELFVNALFAAPSVVTSNMNEAYFTDGQRGMDVVQDNRRLEYINPVQTGSDKAELIDLIDFSVNNINEHKGWTNDYLLDTLDHTSSFIMYRMYYEGYPTFDHNQLTTIKQRWRNQELYQYIRPLVSIGNLLNSSSETLPSGEEVITELTNMDTLVKEDIKDIQIGYTMQYVDDAYSLTLDPEWYVYYQNEWVKYDAIDLKQSAQRKGGD